MTYKVFQDKLRRASHRAYCKKENSIYVKRKKAKTNCYKTFPMYVHQKRYDELYTKL